MDMQELDAKYKRETGRHMTEFEKLQNAARLIEEMAGCRLKCQGRGAFIALAGIRNYATSSPAMG